MISADNFVIQWIYKPHWYIYLKNGSFGLRRPLADKKISSKSYKSNIQTTISSIVGWSYKYRSFSLIWTLKFCVKLVISVVTIELFSYAFQSESNIPFSRIWDCLLSLFGKMDLSGFLPDPFTVASKSTFIHLLQYAYYACFCLKRCLMSTFNTFQGHIRSYPYIVSREESRSLVKLRWRMSAPLRIRTHSC